MPAEVTLSRSMLTLWELELRQAVNTLWASGRPA